MNANESSLPPSPAVLEMISRNKISKIGFYSDPYCKKLRKAIAETYHVSYEQVFVGNGSDEVLAFCFMCFFSSRMKICFPDITYDFYRAYAKTNRLDFQQIPLRDDFTINVEDYINTDRDVIIANPNNPTGLVLSVSQLERIVAAKPNRMVIIDEAYVDYENDSCISLVEKYSNLIVIQSFSKSRNLAGARIGFAISTKEIIEDMNGIKSTFNPFNMSEFALDVGSAAIKDTVYLKACIDIIIQNRERSKKDLIKLGFKVLESSTNFLFMSHPYMEASELCKNMRERGILVRHYSEERINGYIRMTIGTEMEMKKVIEELESILEK